MTITEILLVIAIVLSASFIVLDIVLFGFLLARKKREIEELKERARIGELDSKILEDAVKTIHKQGKALKLLSCLFKPTNGKRPLLRITRIKGDSTYAIMVLEQSTYLMLTNGARDLLEDVMKKAE